MADSYWFRLTVFVNGRQSIVEDFPTREEAEAWHDEYQESDGSWESFTIVRHHDNH